MSKSIVVIISVLLLLGTGFTVSSTQGFERLVEKICELSDDGADESTTVAMRFFLRLPRLFF